MTTTPEVTVVIPTHNRWHLLSTSALPSALKQEEVDLEIVVVDDGSSDETAVRLEELEHPLVRTVRHGSPRGVGAARNSGISVARGEWIAFLDDDDLWSPRKLRTQIDVGRAEDADFVYAAAVSLSETREVFELTAAPDAGTVAAVLRSRCVIPGGPSNVVARSDLVRAVGGFDEALSYIADWDMWIRLAEQGRPAACDECLVGYVRHPERMLPSREQALLELDHMTAKHRTAGIAIEPARYVAWIAYQYTGAGRRAAAAGMLLRSALSFRRPFFAVRAGAALLDGPAADFVRRVAYRRHAAKGGSAPPPPPPWLDAFRPSSK